MNKTLHKIGIGLAILVLLGSTILRVKMYQDNRSLFIDEACLSSQIVERPYLGLFDNLEYQYAPPLFAIAEKGLTQIWSANEKALRLIPLLAGIFALVLFFLWSRKYVNAWTAAYLLVFLGFALPMLRYATEVKQYSTDVLITIVVLYLTDRWKLEAFNHRHIIWWSLTGVILIWCSMPVVFLLFGLGIYWLWTAYTKKLWKTLKQTSLIIGSWLISFGIYYFQIIRKDIGLKNLEDYHNNFFLPLLPTSSKEWMRWWDIPISFFETTIGTTVIAIFVGILGFGLGIWYMKKQDGKKILLFCLPILATMLASGLKLYSLIPRLTLFFIPIILLLIGIGYQYLFDIIPKRTRWLLVVLICIPIFNLDGFQYFKNKLEIEELRPVLEYISKHRKDGDQGFLHYQAENAYIFYSQQYEHANELRFPDLEMGSWKVPLGQLELAPANRRWLIFSHVGQDQIKQYLFHLSENYKLENEVNMYGAHAYLLVAKSPHQEIISDH